MSNTIKLVKGELQVIVNNDPSDIQYQHWSQLGFVVEGEAQFSEPVKDREMKDEQATEAVKAEEQAPLAHEDLVALPKATLISMAQAKEIEVTDQMPKDTIINLLMGL